jgi:sterol desaturase/sphingolipid hydroxylase (fatty acid hydroxylase superfamily)
MLPILLVAVAYGVLIPIERLVGSAEKRRPMRANLLMIIPVVLANLASAGVVALAAGWADDHRVGLMHWLGVSGAAAIVAAIVLVDLLTYFQHRVSHRLPGLWGLHRPHHTDVDVDITTTLRTHPLEVVVNNGFTAGMVVAIGAGVTAAAVAGLVWLGFGLLIHARLRFSDRWERLLGMVFQTPALHRMHHSPFALETDTNFGTVFVWWDRLFGTYSAPNSNRVAGLDTIDLADRQTVTAMLAEPWRALVKPTADPVLGPVQGFEANEHAVANRR